MCLLLELGIATSARAALAPEERAIADWLGGQREPMIALLEKSVAIDSATENHAGVRAVADLFGAELKSAGLTPRWAPLPPETQRAGHLVAEHAGKRGKRLLLIGHLDTVLHGGKFTRDGKLGRGAGANDIKGGDVVLIYALKALAAVHAIDDAQIVAILTGDEESVGEPIEVARRELLDAAKRSDVALAFETGIPGQGTIARRGSSAWQLEVTGPTAHSSGIFSAALGNGAVYEAARFLDAWQAQARKFPGLTSNVALLAGGADVQDIPLGFTVTGKDNIIPPVVRARGDLRAMSPDQLAEAEAAMQKIAAQNGPRTQTKVAVQHRYPPMAISDRNRAVLAEFDRVSRDLGQGEIVATDPAARGAGDSAFAAPYCAVLDGLGAFGRGSHAASEMVELDSLVPQATRVAVLIYRLTR